MSQSGILRKRLIKQVSRTKKALRVTHRGRPIAELITAQSPFRPFVLGDMVGTGDIVGDIVLLFIGR
jgi:hypothetical protein